MEKPGGTKAQKGTMVQMINFTVGTEQYGVDIRKVREVIQPGEVTPLPHAPAFVKGVINLRGDVIPIIDLREKLGQTSAGSRPAAADTAAPSTAAPGTAAAIMDRVIVVEIEEKLVGMIVDSVSHVVRVAPGNMEPAPVWLGGLTADHMTGVVRLDNRLIVVLNIDTILTSSEKFELQALERHDVPVGDKGARGTGGRT